jgi:hypothetical protein
MTDRERAELLLADLFGVRPDRQIAIVIAAFEAVRAS